MLGRLIRHEWKSTYRMGCLVLCAMVIITFFGWLAFQTPMWKSLGGRGGSSFGWPDVLSIVTLVMYVMLLVCVIFGMLIYLGIHFYRSMYTDEGYLTHTLPVTKNQLLVSKILVSGIWMLFVTLSINLSLLVLGLSLLSVFKPEGYSLAHLWTDFMAGIWQSIKYIDWQLDIHAVRWLVLMVASSLVGPFLVVTILFGAISIGQLASKYRLLTGIICYIVIQVVDNLIVSLFRSFATSIGWYLDASLISSLGVNLLTAVVLYWVSYYVTSRKLNMI